MTDVLKLAFKGRNPERLHEIEDRFGSLGRLYPFDDGTYSRVHDGMAALRSLFTTLSGRSEYLLTSGQFESLGKHAHIKKCSLQRIDLHIIFQKAGKNAK